jgi:hypothetical protein
MTEPGRAEQRNLTGVWNGLYTYQNGRSTSFVATLIESGGSLSGTTHEPSTAETPGAVLFASLVGTRSDSAVTFTKTYERPDIFHRSPIRYEGMLNGESTEIEGRWTIVRFWFGKFLMIRSPDQEMKAERKAYERT